jgi:hypothetical protein
MVYAFYFVLFEAHDCVLHTQDVFFDIPSDTREQDNYPSNAYYGIFVNNGTLNFFWLLPYWLYIDEHFDMPRMNKTFAFLFWDYVAPHYHNADI